MKNTPDYKKIIKGNIPLTINFVLEHTGLLIDDVQAIRFNKMLVDVYNAGKGGYIRKEIKDAFKRFWKMCPMKVGRDSSLKAYAAKFDEVGEAIMYKGMVNKRPEMLAKIAENKRIYGPSKKHQFMLHPVRMIKESFWEEFDIDETRPVIKEKVKPILTVDEIMTSKQGQYALEKGVGSALLDFVQSANQYPNAGEFKVLYRGFKEWFNKAPIDDIDIRCQAATRIREDNLYKRFWKG